MLREAKEELGVDIIEYAELKPAVVGIGDFTLYSYLVTSWKGQIPEKVLDKGSVLEWVDRMIFKPKLKPVRDLLKLANSYFDNIWPVLIKSLNWV